MVPEPDAEKESKSESCLRDFICGECDREESAGGLHGDISVCGGLGDFGVPVLHRAGRHFRTEKSSLNRVGLGNSLLPDVGPNIALQSRNSGAPSH